MGIVVKLPQPFRKTPEPDTHQPPAFEKPSETYAAKLLKFLNLKSPYEHPLHLRRHSTWSKADRYLANDQWLRRSYNTDSTRTAHWSRIDFDENDPDAIPMPTYNEMIRVHRNEAARLGRPEYKPYVRPAGIDPDAETKAAAVKSAEILVSELERMHFVEQSELGYDHMPRYGGWALKSWWDVSFEKTTRVPVLTAQKCPAEGCDFKSADPKLDSEQAIAVAEFKPGRVSATPDPDGDEEKATYSLNTCLTCDDHEELQDVEGPAGIDEYGDPTRGEVTQQPVRVPGAPLLEPFVPVGEELDQQDSLGRDLGQDIPLGEWKVRTRSPYDLFWANLGVDEDPQNWSEILDVHVETLDWVRARFPDKADKVKAEDREALLKWHPIGGEREVFFTAASADGLLKSNVRVKEYHKKPYMEYDPKRGKWAMNKGRSIMMAGNCVLLDGPFMMESKNNPGEFVPRVHYDYAAHDIRSGGRELHGVSLCEYLFDAQDAINEAKSQTQDTRQRMASPKWLVKRSMNLDYAAVGNAGAHWIYDDSLDGTTGKPEEVGSTTISEGVAREIERDIEYIDRAGSLSEVEEGRVPAGVTAASAIQIMAEQAGEQRRPRIRRIREMLMRTWKHGLQLCHEFVREDRTYHKKNDADQWSEMSWKGLDIMGQCDVQIDPEPEHDTALQKRENMVKAVELGVLNPQGNKKAQNLIARGLDVPADLTEDDDMQYEWAEREFLDYIDRDIEPVVDADLDDPIAHVDQHGEDCHSEKWRDLADRAGWRELNKLISGWNDPLGADPTTGAPQTLFAMIESSPATDPTTGAPLMGKPEVVEAMDPMTGQTIQTVEQKPVTKGSQWPNLLELRIMECWKILAEPYISQNPDKLQDITKVLRFRAHLSAHKMKVEENAMAAAPVAAAPGADATVAGTTPTTAGLAVA